MLDQAQAEAYLDTALGAVSAAPHPYAVLSQLPVPIYLTDAQGAVTYWNRACVEFAGRVPQLGEDRWCVTWRIYTTTGDPLPHEQCPMAQAIREKRVVRGSVAIAMRPDGTRRAFKAYSTPLMDSHGHVTGAVNMLIDVTDEQANALHEQAERCRRLADSTYNRETSKVLGDMAVSFDKTADELSTKGF